MPPSNSMEVQTVTVTRSPVGMVWRWRSEIGYLTGGLGGFAGCWHCIGLDATGVALGLPAAVAVALPWSRRYLAGRFFCLLTRHRLQAVFWELRLHTRTFRLPLVLWIRPTPVGERAWVLLRAGMSPADFQNITAEIATACAARESRVTVSRRFKPLVTINVIRRDLLAPGKVVPSRLPAGPVALPDWLALPDQPAPETDPVPAGPGWPHILPEGDER